MPAPRCPPIHKSPVEWETWAAKYQTYKPVKIPSKLLHFDKFRALPNMKLVSSVLVDRTWKYNLYLHLSGRKHRTLTI